jgi:hypothetical protein
MRGEHELEGAAAGGAGKLARGDPGRPELRERRVERLPRGLAVALVLPAAPQPVVLLGEVRELEVEPEGPQHLRAPLVGKVADHGREVGPRPGLPGGTRLARELPDPLDVLEQILALLLDEDTAEDLAEEPDVAAERRLGAQGFVTAPSLADETSAAYLASTPDS